MPGELVRGNRRPRVVATFDPPGAAAAYRAWQEENAEALASVPPTAIQVEYGRRGAGLYVRVRIDEQHVPESLLPPVPPPAA